MVKRRGFGKHKGSSNRVCGKAKYRSKETRYGRRKRL